MSTLDKLQDMGYDGAEIHYLYRFYGLHQIMPLYTGDPLMVACKQHLILMRQKMNDLINGEDAVLIEEVIDLGRKGLDYEVAYMLSNKPKGL